MIAHEPERFADEVRKSLRRQVEAINTLAGKGMYFFDYGNAFLLESSRAGAAILKEDGSFRYPSYVQDIMGPLFFDYGFGPFRWICTSSLPEDLAETDRIAVRILEEMLQKLRKALPPSWQIICIGSAGRSQSAGGGFSGPNLVCRCQRQGTDSACHE